MVVEVMIEMNQLYETNQDVVYTKAQQLQKAYQVQGKIEVNVADEKKIVDYLDHQIVVVLHT